MSRFIQSCVGRNSYIALTAGFLALAQLGTTFAATIHGTTRLSSGGYARIDLPGFLGGME